MTFNAADFIKQVKLECEKAGILEYSLHAEEDPNFITIYFSRTSDALFPSIDLFVYFEDNYMELKYDPDSPASVAAGESRPYQLLVSWDHPELCWEAFAYLMIQTALELEILSCADKEK